MQSMFTVVLGENRKFFRLNSKFWDLIAKQHRSVSLGHNSGQQSTLNKFQINDEITLNNENSKASYNEQT